MFSQTSEYALRITVYLASLQDRPATIAQIASATCIPKDYLAKILRSLARADLLTSQRGLHGGSTLARSAADISVLEVIQVVDPIRRIITCPLGLKSHGVKLCPLHNELDQAIAMVEKAFAKATIAQMVGQVGDIQSMQELPTEPASGLVTIRVLRKDTAKKTARAAQPRRTKVKAARATTHAKPSRASLTTRKPTPRSKGRASR